MVGQSGLEPPTSRLSVVCSSQLSYWPVVEISFISFAPPLAAGLIHSAVSPLKIKPASLGFDFVYVRVVEINGIEPLTSCLQGRRSPS